MPRRNGTVRGFAAAFEKGNAPVEKFEKSDDENETCK
jgi:hypothetical protein